VVEERGTLKSEDEEDKGQDADLWKNKPRSNFAIRTPDLWTGMFVSIVLRSCERDDIWTKSSSSRLPLSRSLTNRW
jgi:hypothetical protein